MGARAPGGRSTFPSTFIRNVPSDRCIRATTADSPLVIPLPGTRSASGLETRCCKFPSLTLHRRNRSLGNRGCSGLERESAGSRIDKTIWEKCMRALHVRPSAGEPVQQPSGRLGHSWEKGARVGLWDFRVSVVVDFQER